MGPLHDTAALASAVDEWTDIRAALPVDTAGWTRCSEVDETFLRDWETRIDAGLVVEYGRSHPTTVSAYALDWYAGVPGNIGGAFFRLARRVPRLDRGSLAFTCDPDRHYPVSTAVLDSRFWCLPDDPDAAHPDATVVADDRALGAVLRDAVRAHADAFLARYRPGTRLARRALLGAFFDGLDTGIWYGGDPSAAAVEPIMTAAALALPGATPAFGDPSAIYRLTDERGRDHLSRRRIGCCHYYRVATDGRACSTCPRTDDAERVRVHTALEEP